MSSLRLDIFSDASGESFLVSCDSSGINSCMVDHFQSAECHISTGNSDFEFGPQTMFLSDTNI